jgi:hypothetical protein
MSWTRSRENKELETQLTDQQDARTLLFTPYDHGASKWRELRLELIALVLDRQIGFLSEKRKNSDTRA